MFWSSKWLFFARFFRMAGQLEGICGTLDDLWNTPKMGNHICRYFPIQWWMEGAMEGAIGVFIFPFFNGEPRSSLDFPHHLVVSDLRFCRLNSLFGGCQKFGWARIDEKLVIFLNTYKLGIEVEIKLVSTITCEWVETFKSMCCLPAATAILTWVNGQ